MRVGVVGPQLRFIREAPLVSTSTRKCTTALVLLLTAADVLSKLLAFFLLPKDQHLLTDAVFQFVVVVNEDGLGTWAPSALSEPHRGIPVALAYIALACALLAVRRVRRSGLFKVLICAGVFAVVAGTSSLLVDQFASWNPHAIVVLLRASQVAFWICVWWITSRSVWQYTFALLAASALGNFLSLCYPPFGIVDFMYSAFMYQALGFGVFNLADVVYLAGLGLAGAAVVRWLVRRVLPTAA